MIKPCKFLMVASSLVAVMASCGGAQDPFSSGEWRNSDACGGSDEETVGVWWEEVQSGGGPELADLQRDHGQVAAARCGEWLEANR